MRVLVAYGTKMEGTAGIADRIAATLRDRGFEVTLCDAGDVSNASEYDGAVVGSAIYALRWRPEAVRLLKRFSRSSPAMPVWLFHSGPLGDDDASVPQRLPKKVAALAEKLNVRDAATFGGRLPEDSGGPIARAMARDGQAGDWRDFGEITAWAERIANSLGAAAQ